MTKSMQEIYREKFLHGSKFLRNYPHFPGIYTLAIDTLPPQNFAPVEKAKNKKPL